MRTTDPDTGDVLTYSLSGTDADLFDIDPATGQLRTKAVLDSETRATYKVTVNVHDGYDDSYGSTSGSTDASIQVTITVTAVRTPITSGGSGSSSGGGGGGGPPPVPVPSDADLDWNVTLDIESLDREHDLPTGVWSDGQTVWIVDNAAAGADSLFAYELQSGERQADRELELDRRNRFSHGIWSDGELVWIADSGQDRLFVYHLESGERNEERELELAERNSDPRGIWSDGEVIYVLDSVKDALFVYNLEAGDLLAEHALDKLNRSPRGIWSDGVAIWVSDDGAKRLFAYEVGDTALTRNEDLEFTFRSLLKAGNGDPRGIWSDGDVVWVVDEQDDKVYSYNIPDAIVARLSSLTLSELEIGSVLPRSSRLRRQRRVRPDGDKRCGRSNDGGRHRSGPAVRHRQRSRKRTSSQSGNRDANHNHGDLRGRQPDHNLPRVGQPAVVFGGTQHRASERSQLRRWQRRRAGNMRSEP